ncbi:VOC family protein [Arthrobacter sp. zg-Y877]|uniref:VOC family protein n=1 Tax=Arthrobacter sp. zg-Y877 TaxID=3049074 RepID=UPI0025A4C609|nr:VOC family protein [Arthrobacter sp. zg-Y877]MDM7990428.1 VOC family protein [Arthrobacter sp. zg-Y877]
MPAAPDHFPAGAPCWADLSSSDPGRAREFYAGLLGWDAVDLGREYGHYFHFLRNGSVVAGLMQNSQETGFPDFWTVYLSSDDARATADSATAAGGQVLLGPGMAVDQGSVAVLGDPTGGTVGVWQPETHRGFARIDEPSAPVWYELMTNDYAAALDFYRTVFGWETEVLSDTEDFRYTTLQSEDRPVAGVMDAAAELPGGIPSHWEIYFGHADIGAAAEQAEQLGGSVLRLPEDSDYGRLVQLADPTGAAFWLMAATEA